MNRHTPLLLTLSLLFTCAARAVDPSAGPMIGHVSDKSARLWMQFPIAGDVTVTTFEVGKNQSISGLRVGLEGPTPFTCDLPIDGLEPDTSYRIEVKFDGEPVKLPGPPLTIRTAPRLGDEATLTVAVGSSLNIAPLAPSTQRAASAPAFRPHKIPVFHAINELSPRAFIFLGNVGNLPPNLIDFPTTHRAAYRFIADFHSLIRREPDLQSLFRSTATYALYNDRDFGPIGSGADYVFAQESLVAFERFWPNPDWGTPKDPGCFSFFSLGDIDFFLLDARTFRTDKTLFGEAQLQWLQNNLKNSRASFKILAAPCGLFPSPRDRQSPDWPSPTDRQSPDGPSPRATPTSNPDPAQPDPTAWSHWPDEQSAFLQWLGDNHIDGIVTLAGNQPAPAISKSDPAPAATLRYPLFTLACSSLYSSPAAPSPISFGTLSFAGLRDHRSLTLRVHDESGKTLQEQVLLSVQLRNPWRNSMQIRAQMMQIYA